MEVHGMVANGVNVIALLKDGVFYAMTCAWATQIDYDRLIMCIGGQSDTGKAIKVGDVIGFSALSDKQKAVGDLIGSSHSTKIDKRKMASFEGIDGAYVIRGAVNELVGEVIGIEHFKESPDDNIVQIKITNGKQNKGVPFLVFNKED